MKKLLFFPFLMLGVYVQAQVKIGDNPGTINSNSMLEIESVDKGFLPPRVALYDLADVSPLSGTVPAGMLVFSSGGTLTDGYYYWDGTEWKKLEIGNEILVAKTANATLLKSESYVVASNDITVTLPVITGADNGLRFTVKNIGTHTDLVVVKGSGSSTIDGDDSSVLTKNVALSFLASGGNWIVNNYKKPDLHLLDVGNKSSWATIEEVLEFLDEHMFGPAVIRLSDESYEITSTIVIDLPYSLTIQGVSFGTASIVAGTGLTGKPMFRCFSDVYFKMLKFDATTLASYGDLAGEDAIRLLGSGTYNEVKESYFKGFNTTILDSANAELWVFEVDITNAKANGILIDGADAGVVVKVAETDFIGCKIAVNLNRSSGATIQLCSGVYNLGNASDTAIVYRASTFTSFSSISITGNSWNNTGTFINGFDFTRPDGRDANAKVEANAGTADKNPYCFINKVNASTAVTVSGNVWTKANWGANTDEIISKWTISSNKITYQPANNRNAIFTFSGNIKAGSSNKNISICVVKNGQSTNPAFRFGETTLRTITANQPYRFSFLAFLEEIGSNDYFEIFYMCTDSVNLTIEDFQWLVTSQ